MGLIFLRRRRDEPRWSAGRFVFGTYGKQCSEDASPERPQHLQFLDGPRPRLPARGGFASMASRSATWNSLPGAR